MKKYLYLSVLVFFVANSAFACDYTQADKIKHIEYARKGTYAVSKVLSPVFFPLKPVKWIFNDKIQLLFPDNYLPQSIAATLIFTAGALKEFPFDAISPNHYCELCDLKADCIGIKNGIKQTRIKKAEIYKKSLSE